MKEHTEFITDSFTDYAGKVHNFVIAAVSQNLPTRTGQLNYNPTDSDKLSVAYDVAEYIEDYGTMEYLGTVSKVLRIGISICNPEDVFDEKVGVLKAVSRALEAKPTLFATHPGVINTNVVNALLKQEAEYLKNNPESFISGYADMRERYLTKIRMESMKEGFTELEKQVVEGMKKDSGFLDKAMEYLKWFKNQQKGGSK